MAKLTVEIDMDDSNESWEELYRQIEEFAQEEDQKPRPATLPATFDLLLDPDHSIGEAGEFLAIFRGRDEPT